MLGELSLKKAQHLLLRKLVALWPISLVCGVDYSATGAGSASPEEVSLVFNEGLRERYQRRNGKDEMVTGGFRVMLNGVGKSFVGIECDDPVGLV